MDQYLNRSSFKNQEIMDSRYKIRRILQTRTIINFRYSVLVGVLVLLLFFITLNIASAATIGRPMNSGGLVGYWNFNVGKGEATAYDKSGNSNNGTLTNMDNTASWVDGKIGQGMSFDGDNDYVNMEDVLDFDVRTDPLSFSAWVNRSVTGTAHVIISKMDNDVLDFPTGYMFINQGDNTIRFLIGYDLLGGDALDVKTTAAYTDTDWVHLAVTYDGSGDANNINIYKDGVSLPLTITANNPTNSSATARPFNIGSRDNGNLPFDGTLDEVRIYNRVLSAAEVERLYKFTGPKFSSVDRTGLVGWWTFDDAQGSIATDSSENSNHGTLTNMEESDWVNGIRGKALEFDGSNEYVVLDINNSGPLSISGAVTVSAWAWANDLDDEWAVIVTKGRIDSGVADVGPYSIHFDDPTDTLGFYIAGSQIFSVFDDAVFPTGRWVHVVGVWDGTNGSDALKFYRDGILINTANSDITSLINCCVPDKDFAIGNDPIRLTDSRFTWDGKIDDVRVYSRALSADEVSALYNVGQIKYNASPRSKITDGLVGYWTFDGNDLSGVNAADVSGQGNHGVLTNGPVPTIGRIGQALEFDGDDDFVNVSAATSIDDLNNELTIAAWIRPDTVGATIFGGIATKNTGSNTGSWLLRQNSDGVHFHFVYSGVDLFDSLTVAALSVETWSHVVVVWTDSSDDAVFYIDGALTSSNTPFTTGSPETDSTVDLRLGIANFGEVFDGRIDDIRIYNRALSPEEIKRLYNLGGGR